MKLGPVARSGGDPRSDEPAVRDRPVGHRLRRAGDRDVGTWTPVSDVVETDDSIIVTSEVPGLEQRPDRDQARRQRPDDRRSSAPSIAARTRTSIIASSGPTGPSSRSFTVPVERRSGKDRRDLPGRRPDASSCPSVPRGSAQDHRARLLIEALRSCVESGRPPRGRPFLYRAPIHARVALEACSGGSSCARRFEDLYILTWKPEPIDRNTVRASVRARSLRSTRCYTPRA